MNKVIVVDIPSKGRGVIANKEISVGEIVIKNYLLVMSWSDTVELQKHILGDYAFNFDNSGRYAFCLGIGSFINGAINRKEINIDYKINKNKEIIIFTALKNLDKDEELLIDYGRDPRKD